jgi:hypothetical protein
VYIITNTRYIQTRPERTIIYNLDKLPLLYTVITHKVVSSTCAARLLTEIDNYLGTVTKSVAQGLP